LAEQSAAKPWLDLFVPFRFFATFHIRRIDGVKSCGHVSKPVQGGRHVRKVAKKRNQNESGCRSEQETQDQAGVLARPRTGQNLTAEHF
jgi:hypothetical protein